jgi:hypothetical protein
MAFRAALSLALIAATLAQAAPPPTQPGNSTDLPVLFTEEIAAGTITVYGSSPNDPLPEASADACGSNDVVCNSGNAAPSSLCNSLVNYLSKQGNRAAPLSPRSVCLFQNRAGMCCASWANPVDNLLYEYLAEGAARVETQCGQGATVSGLTRNTLLARTCTTQCLSNRANGCQ